MVRKCRGVRGFGVISTLRRMLRRDGRREPKAPRRKAAALGDFVPHVDP